jgi:biotin carboxyl carrier protein
MKFEVVVNGRHRLLEMNGEVSSGAFEFALDGEGGRASLVEVEPGAYSVLLNGRSYEVKAEAASEGCWVTVGGVRFLIDVRDPRRLPRQAGPLRSAGLLKVASPMPGRVIRLLVGAGEEVAAGQGLVVVEAMKMQNEIRSPKAGRVAALYAVEGAAVSGGETLAEVE